MVSKQIVMSESLDTRKFPGMKGRYKFTLAHEIAHIVLHQKEYEKVYYRCKTKGDFSELQNLVQLQDYETEAEIFAGNCTMLGIPLLIGNEEQINELMEFTINNPKENIEINIINKTIKYENKTIQLDMNPSSQNALVEGTWDSVSLMLNNEEKIEIVEKNLPYLNEFK